MMKKIPAFIFKKERKVLFPLMLISVTLFLLSGFFLPKFIEDKKEEWAGIADEKISLIQSEIQRDFSLLCTRLSTDIATVKSGIEQITMKPERGFGALGEVINGVSFSGELLVLDANFQPVYWNTPGVVLPSEKLLTISPGSLFFYKLPLSAVLVLIDTVRLQDTWYYVYRSETVQRDFTLPSKNYQHVSLAEHYSNKFATEVTFHYEPLSPSIKDGRIHTFPLSTPDNKIVGYVSFVKPALNTFLMETREAGGKIQALLLLIAFLCLGGILYRDVIGFRSAFLRWLIFSLYLFFLRWLLYTLEIPTRFLTGDLTDSSLFSSRLGEGLVRSPLEFFITVLFLLIIASTAFTLVIRRSNSALTLSQRVARWISIGVAPVFGLIIVFGLRSLAAALKSVIFDSSIRYFKDTDIIPASNTLFMHLGVFMLSAAVIATIIAIILLYLRLTKAAWTTFFSRLIVPSLVLISGLIYVSTHEQPLFSVFVLLMVYGLVLTASLIIATRGRTILASTVIMMFTASIIASVMMNQFNLELERESLKTTALALNRPSDQFLRFLALQTIDLIKEDSGIKSKLIIPGEVLDADAFRLWNHSPVFGEIVETAITIYDRKMNIAGSFTTGIDSSIARPDYLISLFPDETVTELFTDKLNPQTKILSAIAPIRSGNLVIGYTVVTLTFDGYIKNTKSPSFFISPLKRINTVLDLNSIDYFVFSEDQLLYSESAYSLSIDQMHVLLAAPSNGSGDAWLPLTVNNESIIFYVLTSQTPDGESTVAVSMKEHELTWSTFNLLKVFFIYTLFIFVILILFSIRKISHLRLAFHSFSNKLYFILILASTLPLIIMVAYNRQNISEKSLESVQTTLDERAVLLIRDISKKYSSSPELTLQEVADKISSSTGIPLLLYYDDALVFHSFQSLVKSGFYPGRLPYPVYQRLVVKMEDHFFSKEQLYGVDHHVYYKKFKLNGRPVIMAVSDAFAPVAGVLNPLEFDIFLFALFSILMLSLLMINSFLARNISAPILRLTKAVRRIAGGDYDVRIQHPSQDEIGELMQNINQMSESLKQNQMEMASFERENAWKEMARQVAHEIKNPLTPMKLNVQHLISASRDKKPGFDEMLVKILGSINNQIDTLSQIASEFSVLAKMPGFKIRGIVIHDIIEDVARLYQEESVTIQVTAGKDIPAGCGDESHFRRVLINLIRNAAQANANLITIRTGNDGNQIQIHFCDNGEGINPEYAAKLFHASFSTKDGGMGIGLKLAKQYFDAIGGSIRLVSSEPGKTLFEMTVPVFEQK